MATTLNNCFNCTSKEEWSNQIWTFHRRELRELNIRNICVIVDQWNFIVSALVTLKLKK